MQSTQFVLGFFDKKGDAIMFQTMADLTPVMIGLVGIGQVGVVAWGIRVMRDALRERNKQTDVMLESLRETTRGLRELLDRRE